MNVTWLAWLLVAAYHPFYCEPLALLKQMHRNHGKSQASCTQSEPARRKQAYIGIVVQSSSVVLNENYLKCSNEKELKSVQKIE